MKRNYILSILLCGLFTSCEVAPEPISYNYDECAYCKMKISDIRFGAEIVTSKGKVYKFDSAECLLRTHIEDTKNTYAFEVVTDYTRPHTLIDAKSATYLISANQPSPMGGNLSAYAKMEHAKIALEEKGGKILTFPELVDEYREIFQ